MDCKKCGAPIANGTYCMRCGTNHASDIPIEAKPELKPEQGISENMKPEYIPADKPLTLADLIEEESKDIDTGALSLLIAIIINYSFVTAIQLTGYFILATVSWSSTQGTDNLQLKMMIGLIPAAILVGGLFKGYIRRTYRGLASEATREAVRKVFKYGLLIWIVQFIINAVLPIVVIYSRLGMAGQILGIIWDTITAIGEQWQFILAYIGYILVIVGIISAKK